MDRTRRGFLGLLAGAAAFALPSEIGIGRSLGTVIYRAAAPVSGQYSVSSGGTYTFNVADYGVTADIPYNFAARNQAA